MIQLSKIYLFKDQKDYIKDLTDDNIVNVIGTKGSGKTTSSLKYIDDDDYIVINCDRLFELPTNEKEDISISIFLIHISILIIYYSFNSIKLYPQVYVFKL